MGRARGQMAITSQMIYARLVMTLMEQQAQGALAAAEQAEHAEQEAAG
ncbi:NADH dehydrogenase [Mycobacterium tuberculosis]|uniref:NADH dehydrogenase n=3 Tax=Mycobacterium tuberculosis TaxID=1773 RepID=A0A655AHV2_MYCTX|nr:NADH dehydrogenase [Mycobacterium tuberculosis]CKT29362.1 NADH dehydrogenase [Mycobacterium tuberculosis]